MQYVSTKIIGAREGTEQTERACKKLLELSQHSFGPFGRFQVLRATTDSESVVVTSISSRIFSFSNIVRTTPLMRVLLQLLSNHTVAYGDGGHFVLQCTCLFLLKGLNAVRSGIELSTVLASLEYGLNHIQESLGEISSTARGRTSALAKCKVKVSLKDMVGVREVIRNIIQTKSVARMRPTELEFLSTITLQAVLQSLAPAYPGSSVLRPFVRLKTTYGSPVRKSKVYENSILLDIPVSEKIKFFLSSAAQGSFSREKSEYPILLFNVSMVDAPLDLDLNVEFIERRTDALNHRQGFETVYMNHHELFLGKINNFVEDVRALGVKIVASQKLIHPHLQETLMSNGILPLQRLSMRHIKAVASNTGAHVLSAWETDERRVANEDDLGVLDKLELLQTNDTDFIVMAYNPEKQNRAGLASQQHKKRCRPVSSLLLCAHTECAVLELKKIVENAISAVTTFFEQPFVTPGGGATEFFMAESLVQLAKKHPTPRSKVVDAALQKSKHTVRSRLQRDIQRCLVDIMAATFYKITLNLCPSGESNNFGLLRALRTKHESFFSNGINADSEMNFFGIGMDPKDGNVCVKKVLTFAAPLQPGCIIDLYSAKVNGICVAVETACVMLRVANTIIS
jgi:chaperonin GroEL (HSP60 family)